MTALLLCGLVAFCVVFAVNSSVHSYLIVRYSGGDKVASSVGFYYMSNAAGRFVGTLCSGAIYQYAAEDKAYGLGCGEAAADPVRACSAAARGSEKGIRGAEAEEPVCHASCGSSAGTASWPPRGSRSSPRC